MPKIKIHYFSADAPRLKMTDKGDWIDLYCAETMELHAGDFALVPLGVSMQLPAGYEARTAPRSSTFKRWGILQANSVGVIARRHHPVTPRVLHLFYPLLRSAASGRCRAPRRTRS